MLGCSKQGDETLWDNDSLPLEKNYCVRLEELFKPDSMPMIDKIIPIVAMERWEASCLPFSLQMKPTRPLRIASQLKPWTKMPQ